MPKIRESLPLGRLLAALVMVGVLATGCGNPFSPTVAKKPISSKPLSNAKPPVPDAVGVMIENAPQARPQSGIDQAQVVYEMMAEGGITRYLCFFDLNQSVPSIGPVRSARIYYVHIDQTYGLPLAHAGGNVDALKAISALGIPNLDGLFAASPYFWRITSRRAPHNFYTSIKSLQRGIAAMHLSDGPLRMWPTGPVPLGGIPTSSVGVVWARNSVYSYSTAFTWKSGAYAYTVDGASDIQADGSAILPQNVVVLSAATVPDPDPYTPGSINYILTNGTGWLLRNGVRFNIKWQFGTNGFTFTRASTGHSIALAPGRVFVQVVPQPTAPTFTGS